jgi:hypothetical protein
VRPLTEHQVRRSFLNCSRGEAQGLALPKDFPTLEWDELEVLGWRDPKAPLRGYLVVEAGGGRRHRGAGGREPDVEPHHGDVPALPDGADR